MKFFSSFLVNYAICLFFLSQRKMKTICVAIFAILIVSTTARSYRRGKYHSQGSIIGVWKDYLEPAFDKCFFECCVAHKLIDNHDAD